MIPRPTYIEWLSEANISNKGNHEQENEPELRHHTMYSELQHNLILINLRWSMSTDSSTVKHNDVAKNIFN